MAIQTTRGAASGIAAEWFTPDSEEGSENPARFKIMPLCGDQLDEAMQGFVGETMSPPGVRAALRFGLKGWDNFVDGESGEQVKFNIPNMQRLPWEIRALIAAEIVKRSLLDGDAVKNS